jgi:hypothetical protein
MSSTIHLSVAFKVDLKPNLRERPEIVLQFLQPFAIKSILEIAAPAANACPTVQIAGAENGRIFIT